MPRPCTDIGPRPCPAIWNVPPPPPNPLPPKPPPPRPLPPPPRPLPPPPRPPPVRNDTLNNPPVVSWLDATKVTWYLDLSLITISLATRFVNRNPGFSFPLNQLYRNGKNSKLNLFLISSLNFSISTLLNL